MRSIFVALLYALPATIFADQAGSAKLTQLLRDTNVTRNAWCDKEDGVPDSLVERRSRTGKRAYEIFTGGKYYWFVEVPSGKGVERYYFRGMFIPNGPKNIKFDATEHGNPTEWETEMASKSILILMYAPDLVPTPGKCTWSRGR